MQEKLLLWNLDRDCNFEAGSFHVFYYAWNLEYRTLYPGSTVFSSIYLNWTTS